MGKDDIFYKNVEGCNNLEDIYSEKSKTMRKKRYKMLKEVPRKIAQLKNGKHQLKVKKCRNGKLKKEYFWLVWHHCFTRSDGDIILAITNVFFTVFALVLTVNPLFIEFEMDGKLVCFGHGSYVNRTMSCYAYKCHIEYAKNNFYFEFFRQVFSECCARPDIDVVYNLATFDGTMLTGNKKNIYQAKSTVGMNLMRKLNVDEQKRIQQKLISLFSS